MLQREVQRAEEEGRRSQSIIADYKQICSKLGRRLDEEQSRAKEVWQRLQSTLTDCSSCSSLLDDISNLIRLEQSSPDLQEAGGMVCDVKPRSPTSIQSQFEHQVKIFECLFRLFLMMTPNKNLTNAFPQKVRELELELAQTKLALVEAECRSQDLNHQLTTISVEMQSQSRNSWLQKTLSSIKEATAKKDGLPVSTSTTPTPSSSSFSSAPPLTSRKDSSSSEK